MKNSSKHIDTYFVLLFIEIFFILSIMFFLHMEPSYIDFYMLSLSALLMIISYFKGTIWGVLGSTLVIFIYASYLMYVNIFDTQEISLISYIWIVYIPIVTITSSKIGENINEVQKKYSLLKKEYDELVTIDKGTGLNNIKSFYSDLNREISRARRHKSDLTLMIINIPYYEDLKLVLGKEKIKSIKSFIIKGISDLSRNEDARYILNENTFAILMPETNESGAEVVKSRIKNMIESVSEKNSLNIDILISYMECSEHIKDAIHFKSIVEKDLKYDV